jgi:glycosyltransferase involved in cell wall biosynthesis
MYEHFQEAVDSIRDQTYDNIELILIVDGNETVHQRVENDYDGQPGVKTHCNEQNVGLSESRNNALEYVTGDIVALIDDDAIADERWIEELVSVYESREAIAVGGKMTPIWTVGKPQFLPSEFYWLVGVTHKGFNASGEEVRNTFGSNISFRTWVLEELGGFESAVGRQGEKNLQAHETEFCSRMREEYGQGVIYNPDARVGHKVFEYRTDKRWLLERAFWQGYSKRVMEQIVSDDASAEESAFLKRLVLEFVPGRIGSLLAKPSVPRLLQLVTLFLLTGTVGAGYLYAVATWR